jgi:acyl-CoA synthetase (AMP-forming)/AMP-acid ligase II
MLTQDALKVRADSQPHREIFRCGEDNLTYGEWHRRSSALALSFIEQGVQQEECVALSFAMPEWINYVIALLAVQKVGAIAVSLPSSAPASIVQGIITRTAVRHSIGQSAFPGVNHLDGVAASEVKDRFLDFRVETGPAAIAEIVVTSGSTGVPKLVACPHGNLTWKTLSASEAAKKFRDKTEQYLTHPPVGSNAAQRKVISALRGTRCVYNILPYFDPALVSQLIASRGIETVALVPAKAAALLRACKGTSFGGVKRVHLSSAGTPSWVAEGLAQLFPNATILNWYGLTEGGIFRIGGIYDGARPSWIGYPAERHSVRITDDQGNKLPAGTSGQLWVRDSAPYRRFYYPEGDTAVDGDGWMRTNDVASLDEDGAVTLTGRASNIANVGGMKVTLTEVEEEVSTLEGVLDCAAFKLPHRTTGDMICIGIVSSPDDESRLEKAKARLAREFGYRFPRLWIKVPAIPRTFTGKVEREALAQIALKQFPELDINQEH